MFKHKADKIIIGIMAMLLLSTNVLSMSSGQKQVIVTLGSNVAIIDGKPINLDAPPVIVKGKTMVPLRFIGEAFGAKVDWDNATKSATLTLNTTDCPPCPECPEQSLHNLALVRLSGKNSTASQKSKLFNIENGALELECLYYQDFDDTKLYSASVIANLKKEDGTTVMTFMGIGQKERDDFEKCRKVDKYGCFPLANKTVINNLDKGNYFFEVTAVVDKITHLWAVGISELPK